jgi:ribokinase
MVYVVGAINVDVVIRTARLPGPGETVVGESPEYHGGGKGANASVAAARMGADVVLIGAVGEDDNGRLALEDLTSCGVDTRLVAQSVGTGTGLALIVVDNRGENQIAVGAGANMRVSPEGVAQSLQRRLQRSDCVLVSTEIPGDAVLAAVRSASEIGARCILNPAPPIDDVTRALVYRPILTPNAGECRELADRLGISFTDIESAAAGLCDYTSSPVIVTVGGDGLIVCEPGSESVFVPALAVDVVDTTGAGDTFNGVFAARLSLGDSIEVAANVANRAAAMSVGRVGARDGMPKPDDLTAFAETMR